MKLNDSRAAAEFDNFSASLVDFPIARARREREPGPFESLKRSRHLRGVSQGGWGSQSTQNPGAGRHYEDVIELNEYGSPVTLEAANWFVCFVPGLRWEWWHTFVLGPHKHVFALRPEPTGMWTIFEPWWGRLFTASISPKDARTFLLWASAGDVLQVRESIPGSGSQIRGWMTCAILVSFLLGRGYRAWTPHTFYRCLTRERDVRRVDVSGLLALSVDEFRETSKAMAVHDRPLDAHV